jgi:hypothetical protein
VGAALATCALLPSAAAADRPVNRAVAEYQHLGLTPLSSMPSGRTSYRTLDEVNSELRGLATAHPGLVSFHTAPYPSVDGRLVNYIEITNHVNAHDGKPVFFMMGNIHGNEWPSEEVTLEFAYDVIQNAETNPRVSRLLDHVRLVILPVTNPDGFVADQRPNANDIDLNRNYPFGWAAGPTAGPGPGSEVENKNIMSIVESHQVTELITNHTAEHFILWPPLQLNEGDTPDTPTSYEPLADAMSAATGGGYTSKCSGCDYETAGETINWSYYATRGLAYTIEEQNLRGGNANCSGAAPTPYVKCVVGDYAGLGPNPIFEKGGVRNAFWLGLVYASVPGGHSVIEGTEPPGTKLRLTKRFDLYTQPVPANGGHPYTIPTRLSSRMTVPGNGRFTWGVNPSVRPNPPWQADGLHTGPNGFLWESWTLTCNPPDGPARTRQVTLDKGERVSVRGCNGAAPRPVAVGRSGAR